MCVNSGNEPILCCHYLYYLPYLHCRLATAVAMRYIATAKLTQGLISRRYRNDYGN